MRGSLNREQFRLVDRIAVDRFGMLELVLMENAGRGCADLLERRGARGPVVICCGRGNNGGDGLVLARRLAVNGIACQVFMCQGVERLSAAAQSNWAILNRIGSACRDMQSTGPDAMAQEALRQAQWIVDALLGTGASGEPRPPLDLWIEAINQSPAQVLALDVPSGLDCDTGQPARAAVRANCTATFFARKPGFDQPHAGRFLGEVHVIDIGIPPEPLLRVMEQTAAPPSPPT